MNIRNPEFPGDMVGRPDDDVGDGIYHPVFPDRGKIAREWEKVEEFWGATHIMPAGHMFWFTSLSSDRDEPGWQAKEAVGLKMRKKGGFWRSSKFVVIAPDAVEVIQTKTRNKRILKAGDIIYTTGLRKRRK